VVCYSKQEGNEALPLPYGPDAPGKDKIAAIINEQHKRHEENTTVEIVDPSWGGETLSEYEVYKLPSFPDVSSIKIFDSSIIDTLTHLFFLIDHLQLWCGPTWISKGSQYFSAYVSAQHFSLSSKYGLAIIHTHYLTRHIHKQIQLIHSGIHMEGTKNQVFPDPFYGEVLDALRYQPIWGSSVAELDEHFKIQKNDIPSTPYVEILGWLLKHDQVIESSYVSTLALF